MMNDQFPHCPILVKEFLDFFSDSKLTVYVDGTLGAGGHAEAILTAHPEIEFFLGIDQDPVALEIASKRLSRFGDKVHCVSGNFKEIKRLLLSFSFLKADGIFLDLGVSSMQLDQASRGMSFSKEGPLDMRMDPANEVSAEVILNTWPERELGRIFRDYGEEPRWRAAAGAISAARQLKPLKTTFDLVEVLRPILYRKTGKQINPMTLIFQGLRIAVNEELEALAEALPVCIELLSPHGKLGVISFHSLEDRIVKNTFREASGYKGGKPADWDRTQAPSPATVKIMTKKPAVPDREEQLKNKKPQKPKR